MRILVVDDELAGIQSLKRGLQLLGHSIIVSESGTEALSIFESEKGGIDLIITDYYMPDMSGIDLLRAIRKINRELPVMLVKAYGSSNILIEALQSGCSGFLEKPFTLEQLESELQRICGQSAPSP